METQPPDSATATTRPAGPSEAAARNGLSADFETFLKMLTTQMQNQDPLNPMESQEFAAQLAAFSTVEQQVQTNDLLRSLGAQIQAQGIAELSAVIGMTARSPAPVPFDGTPVQARITVEPKADRAELVVRDADGRAVSRQDIRPESGVYTWTGTDQAGQRLPVGSYLLDIESYAGEEKLATHAVETYQPVVEARKENGQTILVFENGATVPAGEVSALRSPEQQR
ncbi:flagellar hook capping FlgD N-terminal domain-containing protein [Roseovarius salinarum]|uniref:flagellar hook capping FlgD N-terminal domain-containing protein n=1 Tax=Roseovarius salinarum TaxID=1981892 RepID=UPI000C348328|nr:flagellar hook capping FlgD N-terminal domain-containing protein [Roseovarius salinarum]